ncbi:MAG: terpene cyclase/mutase family protein [Candidatus Kapabacteria bacterium]|nr:terpene cyclase/mutase family protein [Candidatus Kapabacteria bacterium]MCS7169361.1 terpene cyclase/mutase family protein [Candidatus Kapabacteria bacterium]MDW7997377.1 terpene cyclase/mutase family protein [Bacteroidota bacterium]MDW8224465.1 terpene cyclase/mutase family protein [Bacteroidota bacterium]
MQLDILTVGWERCRVFMEEADYRGYDPYDALLSPVWNLPILRSWRLARRLGQQLLLRCPVNCRALLRISPGQNPVTLGLALEGYVSAWEAFPERRCLWEERIQYCIAQLFQLRSPGWDAAWGYDFPWEARRMSLPARAPTIVATGIVTQGLFRAAVVLGDTQAGSLCKRAAEELLQRFPRSYEDGECLCWAYSPVDNQRVLNATLMGARLCAHAYALGGGAKFAQHARRSVRFALMHQHVDGSFPYAVGDDPRRWVDHFHTGYVLECLREYARFVGDETISEPLCRGWNYYRRSLFTSDGLPRFSSRRTYPLDATACAQAIRALCRFGEIAAAERVARWAVEHLQHPDGSFAYRRYRFWIHRTVFMRWSVAWMFAALAELLRSRAESGPHEGLD